jgi:hypothetical protein
MLALVFIISLLFESEGVATGHLSRLGLRLVACSTAGERQTGYPVPHIHFARR